jgi:hypothetical protein
MRDPWYLLDHHARVLVTLMVCVVVGAHLISWIYAPYNGDEGIYLYASRLVMEGKLLYRDTFFHQYPLMPYVYGGVLEPLGGGLYLGRLLSVVLGISAFLLLLPVSRVVAGEGGAAAYALLFGLNFWAISNLARVKHYALTAFLLSLGTFFLVAHRGRKGMKIVGTLLAFALAASSRISTLPVLLIACAYLLRRERDDQPAIRLTCVTFVCSLVPIFAYSLFVPFSQMLYGTLGYPLSNYKRRGVYRYITWQLRVFRGLVIFRIPSMAILLLLRLRQIAPQWRDRVRSAWDAPSPTVFLAVASAALFIVHFYVGHVHEDYHVNYLGLVAILAAQAFRGLGEEARRRNRVRAFSYLSLFLAALTIFTGVRYGIFKKDAFQVPSTLPAHYAQADVLARRTSPRGAEILGLTPIVPYLAHRELAHGMEYGVDTYRPDVSDEEARAGNFMNAPQAKRLILSRRAQAVEEKFLLRYLRESDFDGSVAAAIQEFYEKEGGYYYLRSPGRQPG